MNRDEEAIRSLVATWLEATAAGDLARRPDLMADDVVFLSSGRPPMVGKDAEGHFFRRQQDQPDNPHYPERGASMTAAKRLTIVFVLAYGIAFSLAARAQQAPGDGPRYADGTNLIRPTEYREWAFLGAGLGMTYQPPTGSASSPQFGNVFVNPSSYRGFMQTGRWPDGTIFVLEIRNSGTESSISQGGRFQTELLAIEAEVKDSRFPDGWAFFNFGSVKSLKDVAAPLSGENVARCIECHSKHTAVERTFVQFYPTLLEVARQKGTLKPGF